MRVDFDCSSGRCFVLDSIPSVSIDMYSSKSSVFLLCLLLSIGKTASSNFRFTSVSSVVLLSCSVNGSMADSSEQQDHSIEISGEDFDDLMALYRRASLRPVFVHQRASLRPFSGKRASLRPMAGKRASLRPVGKRASLRSSYFPWSRDHSWFDGDNHQRLLAMICSCCFRRCLFSRLKKKINFHRTSWTLLPWHKSRAVSVFGIKWRRRCVLFSLVCHVYALWRCSHSAGF